MVNSERANCGAIRQRKRQRQAEKQHLIIRLESEAKSEKLRSVLSAWKPDIDGLLWQQIAGGAAVLELTKMGVGILAPPVRPPPSVTVATPACVTLAGDEDGL